MHRVQRVTGLPSAERVLTGRAVSVLLTASREVPGSQQMLASFGAGQLDGQAGGWGTGASASPPIVLILPTPSLGDDAGARTHVRATPLPRAPQTRTGAGRARREDDA